MNTMLIRRTLVVMALLIIGGVALVRAQSQTTEEAATSGNPLYAPMTFPIDIDASLYTNPFDASDIELVGVFQAPSGRQVIIPGFWMQPYADQCQQPCKSEALKPSGSATWQVRYAPDEVGHWTYNLQVRDNGTTVKIQRGDFDVTPSERAGFIKISDNQRYFEYDNGQSYFPIGHDLLWSWDQGGGVEAYRQWFEELSDAGGNYARVLIDDPWFIGLEWKGAAGDYRASQLDAARLDALIDMAAQYGISLQLVLLWHQALINYTGAPVVIPTNPPRPDMSADWDNYGYNVLNGGTLSGPALFFSDARAKALFQQRLRYIAARWGYSPQVFSWEIVDEIDHTTNYNAAQAGSWLQDMAGYLRQVDQGRHLITAGSRNNDPAVVNNPALSFTQAHFFQRRPIETTADQIVGAVDTIRQNLAQVPSPALLSEFSLNPWYEPTADDPEGISVQTTLWASAFSGAGGGGMSAWGETYIALLGLQKYYPALAAFASEVDWAHLNLQPAEAALVSDDPTLYKPLRVDNFMRGYGKPVTPSVMHLITADGVLPDVSNVSSYLYGQLYNHQFHQTQQYHVSVPLDTYFEARVRSTSTQAGARLVVSVDGKDAAELVLSASTKNVALRVPLTVGEHDITLENVGDDWLELDSITVGQIVSPVRALTLRDTKAGVALSWLQNRSYTWDHIDDPRTPLLFNYRIDQMPAGKYIVEIWSPLTGAVIGEVVTTVADDGVLQVELVPMSDELAIRAVRQNPVEIPASTELPTVVVPTVSTNAPTLFPLATNTPVLTTIPTETATITDNPNSLGTEISTGIARPPATLTETATLTATLTATRRPTAGVTTTVSVPHVTATVRPTATP